MDKRYQVFLSSTYADLQEERRTVLQALMEMDCIPAGMELFPAADEEQRAFIRRVIDDCDYYLLIIGNRYGSVTEEGISYTEMEYRYAEERGLPIIAFIHREPDQLPVVKSDIDPTLRAKLESFRGAVASGRLVKYWNDTHELPGLVALSLQKTIKTQPRTGWVRASALSNAEALGELNELRKRNDSLAAEVEALKMRTTPVEAVNDLAPLDAPLTVSGSFWGFHGMEEWRVTTTWKDLFSLIAPYLLDRPNDNTVKVRLEASLFALSGAVVSGTFKPTVDDQQFQTVKVQLMAHSLVSIDYLQTTTGGMALFWTLTKAGRRALVEWRTVRASKRDS